GDYRVPYSRRDRRHAGFAHPRRRLCARHDMDFDLRRFVHAQHLVVVKVALLDATFVQRDRALQRGRQAEDDPAFHLRLDRVGVDDAATIHRANHTMHAHRAILADGDLGYLSDVTLEGEVRGNAAATAGGQTTA